MNQEFYTFHKTNRVHKALFTKTLFMNWNKRVAITALVVSMGSCGFAQEVSEASVKRVKVTDFYLTGGFVMNTLPTWSISDFQTLAPNSQLMDTDFTGYDTYSTYHYGGPMNSNMNTNKQVSMMLGFSFSDKDKTKMKGNPHLRIGLTYRSGELLTGNAWRTDRYTFDTLSSSGGNEYTVDSVFSNNYRMNYSSQQLHIDVSVLFRTSPERKASLFGGIGITTGVGLNSKTNIDYNQQISTTVNYPSYQEYSGHHGSYTYQSDAVKNETAYGFSAYVPMGLDIRLGNRNEFWKRIHLSLEMRPSLNVFVSPELGTMTTFASYHGLGMKVNLR